MSIYVPQRIQVMMDVSRDVVGESCWRVASALRITTAGRRGGIMRRWCWCIVWRRGADVYPGGRRRDVIVGIAVATGLAARFALLRRVVAAGCIGQLLEERRISCRFVFSIC